MGMSLLDMVATRPEGVYQSAVTFVCNRETELVKVCVDFAR